MEIKSRIKQIIKELEEGVADFESNVIDLSSKEDRLPADLKKMVKETGKENIKLLNQVIRNIDHMTTNITNRAREELSVEQHNAVYNQLNDMVDDLNNQIEPPDFETNSWADAWLLIHELTTMAEENSNDELKEQLSELDLYEQGENDV